MILREYMSYIDLYTSNKYDVLRDNDCFSDDPSKIEKPVFESDFSRKKPKEVVTSRYIKDINRSILFL